MGTHTLNASLDLVEKVSFRYLTIENLWGEFGERGRAMRFSLAAAARVGHTLGFIQSLRMRDEATAAILADGFISRLDYLANYGGESDDQYRIPNYLVDAHDDGSWGGLGLCWYRAQTINHPGDEPLGQLHPYRRTWSPHYRWVYSFNGGLIFHGWRTDSEGRPKLCVSEGSSPWGVHT